MNKAEQIRDLDGYIQSISQPTKLLPQKQVQEICDLAQKILVEEDNVKLIQSPVTVVGDIQGQFFDLQELFNLEGFPPYTNYLFLGDYVDRGYQGVNVFTLLLALKVRYSKRITLLRGNHDSRQITQVYGFYDECMKKYRNASV